MYPGDEAPKPGPDDSDQALRVSANVVGAGDETYSTFAKGSSLTNEPPKPTVTIQTRDGKEVASGNLEFG